MAEQAEYERKQAKSEAYQEKNGKKPRGKDPKAPTSGPQAKDQVNLTDEESRIMPTSSGGFKQTYNAQAGVDIDTHLIVEEHVTQHPNGKQEITPDLKKLDALPEDLGAVETLLADTGFHSEANIERCENADIEPRIPAKRGGHNPPLAERFADDPAPPESPSPAAAMQHRFRTRAGKALYAKRKST